MQPEFHNIFAAGEGSSEAESEREKRAAPPPPFMQPRVRVKSYSESAPVRTSEHPDAAANADMQMQVSYIWRLWWDLPTNESIILGYMHIFSSLIPWPLPADRVEDV